jgi:hypothetical protein
MLYEEKRELHSVSVMSSSNEEVSQPVNGPLLVGLECALSWSQEVDTWRLYPAFYKGERAWVQTWQWTSRQSSRHHGYAESILTFQEGVEKFLEHGVFQFPAPPGVES